MHNHYRSEIDGLRAVAIAAVIWHHAALPGLPGGFAGVDVFFVISGYLITHIIAGELTEGRFSLLRFYERRVRRIVPALAAMLIATGMVGWLILIPEDFHHLSKALIAAAVFASNFLFARNNNYFSTLEGSAPLIHTWTLGVEEQFYLAFPLLLIGLARGGRSVMLAGVAALGAASFALAVIAAPLYPLEAFYLLPTRLWELVLGALCALAPPPARQRGEVAMAGLALVLAGFWLITPQTSTPGAMFLLPTIGTALAIRHTAPASFVQRLLSLPPLTWLGVISFGAYLWHQPILALGRYLWLEPMPLWLTALAVALTIGLATLSYRWLEQPVRRGQFLGGRLVLAAGCGAALAVPLAAGAGGYLRHIMPPSGTEAVRLGGFRPPDASRWIVLPATPEPPAFLLYGDSHAAQYRAAMEERLGQGAIISHASCLAAVGLSNQDTLYPDKTCLAQLARMMAAVSELEIKTVIWAQVLERPLYPTGSDEPMDDPIEPLIEALKRTAGRLPTGTEIILIGNVPTAQAGGTQFGNGWLRCRAYLDAECPSAFPPQLAEGRAVNARLALLAAEDARFAFVDPHAILCRDGQCLLVQDGSLNYWDGTHLTLAGARRVAAHVTPQRGSDGQ